MESNNRKYTILSFLVLSSISAYVFYLMATQIADFMKWGGSDVLFGQSWVVVGGTFSVLFGTILFFGLSLNSTAVDFTDDVFVELSKTTWPTGKETMASTVVVSIMVTIFGVMLFVMDQIFGFIFRGIL